MTEPGKYIYLALVFGAVCCAQNLVAQPEAGAAYRFSATGQAAIDRLAAVGKLPADDWLYHAGGAVRGENADLDVSDWQKVILPFSAPTGEVWLRRWITVPQSLNGYDLSGAKIWFNLSFGRPGPGPEYAYQILYLNGERVAEGQHLERRVLFGHARPGRRC